MYRILHRHCSVSYVKRFSSLASERQTLKNDATAFMIGATAGSVGSLIGLGGSFIALPMLTGILKMPQHLAHGTGLATVLCTAIGGTLAFSQASQEATEEEGKDSVSSSFFSLLSNGKLPETIGNVDTVVAVSLASASSMAVAFGAKLSKAMSPFALKLSMGILQIVVGPLIPLRSYLKEKFSPSSPDSEKEKDSTLLKAAKSFFIGSGAGVLAGIFGVGGGALQIPALCLFTDIEYHTALGTSLFAMMPVAIVGSIIHYRQNTLAMRVAIPLGIGSFIGSYFGGSQAKNIDTAHLQYVFPVVMMTLGVTGIVQARKLIRK